MTEEDLRFAPVPGSPTRAELLAESQRIGAPPYLLTDDEIGRSRLRFAEMRALVDAGKVEAGRRVWWWPEGEDPPTSHWMDKAKTDCICPKRIPGERGIDGLCRYCKGRI